MMAAIQVQLYEVVTERNHVVISEASHSEVVMIAGAEMRDLHSAEMMGRVVTSEMTVLVEAEMIAGAEMRGLKVEMVTERIAAAVVEVTEEDRIETERKEAVDGAAEEVVVPMIATGGLEELTLAGTRVELAEVKILADVEEKGTTSGAEMITVIVIEIIAIMVIEGGMTEASAVEMIEEAHAGEVRMEVIVHGDAEVHHKTRALVEMHHVDLHLAEVVMIGGSEAGNEMMMIEVKIKTRTVGRPCGAKPDMQLTPVNCLMIMTLESI